MGTKVLLLALLSLVLCHSPIHGLMQVDITIPSLRFSQPMVLSNESLEFLKAHNDERARVRVDHLFWSHRLANIASRLIHNQNGCNFVNLTASKVDQYGDNQHLARELRTRPDVVVNAWVAKKRYDNYGAKSCGPKDVCGAYRQVVWSKTRKLGCSQATCRNYKGSLTICLYYPPANYHKEGHNLN